MKLRSAALILLAAALPAVAGPGTSGYTFLRLGQTAREMGMGGTAIALVEDGAALLWNPAGLAHAAGAEGSVSYLNYIAGIQTGLVTYARPAATRGWAAGLSYLNGGSIPRTDADGQELGTSFAPQYVTGAAGLATQLAGTLHLGGTLKLSYASIDTFWSAAAAIDFGLQWHLMKDLIAGLAVRNLGIEAKAFDVERSPMPLVVGAGLGWRPVPAAALGFEVLRPIDSGFALRLGGEWWLSPAVALRLGYDTAGRELRAGGGADILAGTSAGIGVRWRSIQLDYAFTPYVLAGNGHRLTLAFALQ